MPVKAGDRRGGQGGSMAEPLPYAAVGGAAAIRALATSFYARIDADPEFAELRAIHDADLGPVSESLAGFLSAWLGGPRDWFTERPGRCIMRFHAGFAVSPRLAAQWAEAMLRTMAETPGFDTPLGRQLGETLMRMAFAMVRRSEDAALAASN